MLTSSHPVLSLFKTFLVILKLGEEKAQTSAIQIQIYDPGKLNSVLQISLLFYIRLNRSKAYIHISRGTSCYVSYLNDCIILHILVINNNADALIMLFI